MSDTHIEVKNLDMKYGTRLIQHSLNFEIKSAGIFIIMGGSGCGKSTLLRHLTGLMRPAKGQVLFNDIDFWQASTQTQNEILTSMGVLFQSGALWSSMTLAENVVLPLEAYTDFSRKDRYEIASLKLALVGLNGFENFYPSEISGGMRKRAGLARALALDPEIVFFDEPSAGLDPISSKRLDDLILELRDSLGTTVVVVTHELASIFAIGDDSVFLDPVSKTMIAGGNPNQLLADPPDPKVFEFLSRGDS